MSDRVRPAHPGGEKETLAGWLDLRREIVLRKCEGLSGAASLDGRRGYY